MNYYNDFGDEFVVSELDDIGQEMSVGEFVENIIDRNLVDYDGFVRFVVKIKGRDYILSEVNYSIYFNEVCCNEKIYGDIITFCQTNQIKDVIWYNR